MSFPAYADVAETNTSWLGMLPCHWSVARVRQLFEIKKRIAGSLGHDVLSITQSGIRIKDLESNDGQVSMDYSNYQIVNPGDFAMNHMDLLTGWVDISSFSGVTSPDYRVFSIRPTADIDRKFFLYIFQMGYEQKLFYPLGQGSSQLGRWRLPSDAFNEFPVPVPPREEQATIAAFLDRETAKIDALVEEQRRLIALLKEKRQAIISEGVTRGINPGATMKESGIEWLGEVPAHWKVERFSRIAAIAEGQVDPREEPYASMILVAPNHIKSGTGQVTLLETASDQGADSGKYFFSKGDILYSKIRPSLAKVIIATCDGICSADMYPLKPRPGIFGGYLKWLLLSSGFTAWASLESDRVAMPKINREALNSLHLPVPPLDEQSAIASYVTKEAEQVDRFSEVAAQVVRLLDERRAALISAAVTGKIDVRSSAELLPVCVSGVRVRGLVAAEIIERSARQATFGRVKLQKIAYLAQAHVGVSELEGNYLREAAGPLDRQMVRDMECEAGKIAGLRVDQPEGQGTTVRYRLGDQRGTHRAELALLLGAYRSTQLNKLIDDIALIDTKGAEAIATLYAVWNDALIDGETPTDNENVLAVLTEWHPEKKEKFRMNELHAWLGWMRRHEIVPCGTGPKTSKGRLFA